MSEEITKQEVLAMIEVQSKTAQQMESIANSLHGISEAQKEITTHLTNGLASKIVTAVTVECEKSRKKISDIGKDVFWLKIILGSVGLVSALTLVVMKLLGG